MGIGSVHRSRVYNCGSVYYFGIIIKANQLLGQDKIPFLDSMTQ